MTTELERLRRRLYVADAEAADLARYRRALDAAEAAEAGTADERPAAEGDRPADRRRWALPALLAVVVVVLAASAALAGGALRPDAAARLAAAPATARPPLVVTATAGGLSDDVGLQRLVDRAFADRYSEQSAAAADSIHARIRRALLPDATAGTIRASAGGRGDDGESAVIEPPSGTSPVTAGELLLLSVVTREPAASRWRVLGWRSGEPHRPHVIVEVRSGDADRIAVALVRAPEAMTVTSVRVTVAPRTPFLFRAEQHGPWACRDDGCDTIDPAVGG